MHHAHLNPSMAVLDPEDGMNGQFVEVSQSGVLWSSLNWISAKILAEVRVAGRPPAPKGVSTRPTATIIAATKRESDRRLATISR